MKIECRTIDDDRIFISVEDMAAALRLRAADFDRTAENLGDPLGDEDFTNATAYRAVAEELRSRADWLDVATVAHISD